MAVGDGTKVTVIGNNGGARWQCVFHYETLTSFGPKSTELDGLIDAFTEVLIYKQITNDALDFMHDSNFIERIELRDIDDPTIGIDWPVPVADRLGKQGGDELALQLAVLIRKNTDKLGKSYQGRNYWQFLTEDFVSGGKITANELISLADWAATLLTIISVSLTFSFRLVVYSPTLGLMTPVTSIAVATKMKTQRRRAV